MKQNLETNVRVLQGNDTAKRDRRTIQEAKKKKRPHLDIAFFHQYLLGFLTQLFHLK